MKDKVLNENIIQVLCSKYKKDCPDAHAIVSMNGYIIEKYDGCFHVKNLTTKRNVWIERKNRSYINRTTTVYDKVPFTGSDTKFDFVGYLNKPFNDNWMWEINNRSNHWTKYRINRDNLIFYKNRVKWKKEDIETTKKNIAFFQEKLEIEIKELMEKEYDLKELKIKLGLERRNK